MLYAVKHALEPMGEDVPAGLLLDYPILEPLVAGLLVGVLTGIVTELIL